MSYSRGNYGLDGPTVLRNFVFVGLICCVISYVAAAHLPNYSGYEWTKYLVHAIWPGAICLVCAMWMFFGSKVFKLHLRDQLIVDLKLLGHEQVLDVGCGRGLLLLGIAKYLGTGRATGIDIWQTVDQSGNAITTTEQNARLEGVASKVALHTGDMQLMPFNKNQFDVVVSSWAIHNIYNQEGRKKALEEIVRVLRPGGKLAIVDISHISEYVKVLKEAGISNIEVSGPNFLFMLPTRTITGMKKIERV